MKTIRVGVFETNSSSVHSITVATADIYEKWKTGEYILDLWGEKLVPTTPDKLEKVDDPYDKAYYTFEEYDEALNDYDSPIGEYDEIYDRKRLPDGQEIVIFGYVGHNG